MTTPPDLLCYATDFPAGTILRDHIDPDSGLRMLVMRGPFSFCAYVGVPADHTLAGLPDLEFECHFGITFSQWGREDTPWEKGWYWWGWDYAHYLDHIDWEGLLPLEAPPEEQKAMQEFSQGFQGMFNRSGTNHTLGSVVEDALDVMMSLKAALQESEQFSSLLHENLKRSAQETHTRSASSGQATENSKSSDDFSSKGYVPLIPPAAT